MSGFPIGVAAGFLASSDHGLAQVAVLIGGTLLLGLLVGALVWWTR